MTAKSSAVDSASPQGTTDSSFPPGVGNDLQQRCHTIESGLNDLRNVLKTLTTTCAILERSAEKLGSDMMEIRGILARNHSSMAGQDISERRRAEGARGTAVRLNQVSLSKLDTPIPRPSDILPFDTSSPLAGPSGTSNATRISPNAKQPGAYITPVGPMSVSSVVPPAEGAWPTASSSSQSDTPARPVVPSFRATAASNGGPTRGKRKKDDLMDRLSKTTPSQTLPPRRARKQGLGFPKPVPPTESPSHIEVPIIDVHAQKVDTSDTGGDLGGTNASSSSTETLIPTDVARHNPPKQVHFDAKLGDESTGTSDVRTPVKQLEVSKAETSPIPVPRMELRIRIRNPTKNTPGRIENISGLRVRIPKAVLEKMPASMASSVPPQTIAAPTSIPSSQVSGFPKMATTSAPVPSSKPAPKAKRPVGRPRKRRKTAPTSKKVKQEEIETSLTADAPLLQTNPASLGEVGESFIGSISTGTGQTTREEQPAFEFTSLSKALEKCKDAFSNYLAAASRESTTPVSSTGAPPSSKRAPAHKRLASSSVPSATTFSPKIETQDFPLYPSTSSASALPQGFSSTAATPIATPTVPVAPLPVPLISPPFLVPSNVAPTNSEQPKVSTATTATRTRRQRGSRLAELDREAEERMQVSREKRDKTRWDPGSGRRVVVPAGVIGDESHSGVGASVEGLVRPSSSRGRGTGKGMPVSRGLTQGAGTGKELKMTDTSSVRVRPVVIVKEEEIEW